ncbi:MAG: hypothetical protein EPN55_05825 [Gammaproteobacteria bacterium]|nr:MAG: hypothetical protein EPN55_05825 [Gammaproteobacteria bacterium]
MCNPAALLAIQVAQTVISHEEQRHNANKTADAIKDGYKASDAQMQERYKQINADAAEKQSARAREAQIERSRIAAASGESGLGGINAGRLEGEAEGAYGRDATRIETDRAGAERASFIEMQGIHSRSQSRLNQIKYPSLVQSGLQIAGSYLNYKKDVGEPKKTGRERYGDDYDAYNGAGY